MRVTFISDEWRRNGGVASYLHRLSAALIARGDEVQVVHADRRAPSVAGVRDDYVDGATAYGLARASCEAATAAAMAAVRGFAPDVVHVQSCNNFSLERELRARYRSTKTLHVYDFCPSNTKYHHALDRECSHPTSLLCLPRMGYKGCTTSRRPTVWARLQRRAQDANRNNGEYAKLAVASRHVRTHALATGYPAAQVEVVPYFVDTPAPPSAPEPRLIVAAGRLVREKGMDLLLASLARIQRPWRAVIAGDGLEAAALKSEAQTLGLGESVDFAGWQDERGVAALLERASVVVVPSRWPEPSGIIGLEAMAHGRPVVAFATGGIPEWLEHGVTGLLVPPLDSAALASSIESILGDSALAAGMGAAGRARVTREFSPASHLAQLDALYASLPGPA
jgi:glycosyltransferase involved in cell wall biosynthesis